MNPSSSLHTQILKSVARSFYLSVRILPPQMRPVIGLGYLLCRTADTIADTDVLPASNRLKTLGDFQDLFDTFPLTEKKLAAFVRDLSNANTIPATREGRLLGHFDQTAQAFSALSRGDQALVQEVVLSVIKGMVMDLKTFGTSREDLTSFQKTAELETYIGWIGGTPGTFWSKVCLEKYPSLRKFLPPRWVQQGFSFGKGLQRVNILRDLPEDLKHGRCYLPDSLLSKHDLTASDLLKKEKTELFLPLYHTLIDETLSHFQEGLRYLVAIPRRWVQLRAATWWPMAIGLKTLRLLRESPSPLAPSKPIKVTRGEIYRLLAGSLPQLFSNRWLKRTFDDWAGGASSSMNWKIPKAPEWD